MVKLEFTWKHRSKIGLDVETYLKVPLVPWGLSCPVQAILLGDLVGFGSTLQI